MFGEGCLCMKISCMRLGFLVIKCNKECNKVCSSWLNGRWKKIHSAVDKINNCNNNMSWKVKRCYDYQPVDGGNCKSSCWYSGGSCTLTFDRRTFTLLRVKDAFLPSESISRKVDTTSVCKSRTICADVLRLRTCDTVRIPCACKPWSLDCNMSTIPGSNPESNIACKCSSELHAMLWTIQAIRARVLTCVSRWPRTVRMPRSKNSFMRDVTWEVSAPTVKKKHQQKAEV